MPTNRDCDPTHIARETPPEPSSVSVRGSRHPSLASAALTVARASSGVPAYVTTDQVAAMVACAPHDSGPSAPKPMNVR